MLKSARPNPSAPVVQWDTAERRRSGLCLNQARRQFLAAPRAVIVDRTVDPKTVVAQENFGGGAGAQ